MADELERWIAAAHVGDASSVRLLRIATRHDLPEIRLYAHVGLARAGDLDPSIVDEGLIRESDLAVYAVLAARAGSLAISARSLDALDMQAGYAETPPALRAGCAWALAAHDLEAGAWHAGVLLAELEPAFWLASIVAHRGGGLAPLVIGLAARAELDVVGALVLGAH